MFVGLRAHVCYICDCWPLCHVYCRFCEPPRAGEVLLKFLVDTNLFCPFFCRRTCGRDSTTCQCTGSPLTPFSDVINTLGIISVSLCGRRSPVRRLPSERDTVRDMRISAYLRPYLLRIVHVFWTARGCVDGLVSMLRSGSR